MSQTFSMASKISLGPNRANLTHLKPTNGKPTSPTIQGFKEGRTDTWVIAIIVGKFDQWQVVIPITLEVNYTCSQHIFQSLDGALCFPIVLWMKGCSKINTSIKNLLERFPKLRSELGTMIGDNGQGNPMQPHHFLQIQLIIVLRWIRDFDGNKWANFIIQSTITQIESYCRRVRGKQTMKPMFKSSHFQVGMLISWDKLLGFWCSNFTCWSLGHLTINSAISFFIHSTNRFLVCHDTSWWLSGVWIIKNYGLQTQFSLWSHQN